MSHWRTCKTKLKSPLSVLRKSLIAIMPQWAAENKIQVDEEGNLVAVNTWKSSMASGNEDKKGVYLKVRHGKTDIAFSKDADGSWVVHYDPYELPVELRDCGSGVSQLENKLLQEIGACRAKEIAKMKSMTVAFDGKVGGKRVVRMLKPLTPKMAQ